MKIRCCFMFVFLMTLMLIVTACGSPNVADESQAPTLQAFPTLAGPSGTVIENQALGSVLSHPDFGWTVTVPDDWNITYDAGYQINANNPDKTIFVRLQAQRWAQESDRVSNARDYVAHWKNFSHGNIFPLFADGTQVSETEIGLDKFGGPYLQYEFDDGRKQIRYLQVYASAGGPSSAMVTTWTIYNDYDQAQATMQKIIDSFELLENVQ